MNSEAQICKDKICSTSLKIPTNSTWMHYKGGVYKILGFGINTLDGEVMVRYIRIDGPEFNHIFVEDVEFFRPFSEWFDEVVLDNHRVSRFKKVHKVERWEEIKCETQES